MFVKSKKILRNILSSNIYNFLKLKINSILKQETIIPKPYLDRKDLAERYLNGEGIEIGALHMPLEVPSYVKVKYVDRFTSEDLRKHYPELQNLPLVPISYVEDGETLSNIPDNSQDFVIANHFLEHTENPIKTLLNFFRVLKYHGKLYMAIPDKRYSFDINRPVTPYEHLLKDFEEGPHISKRVHFEEWVKLVEKITDPKEYENRLNHLLKIDYSIHYHVWTQHEIVELVQNLRKKIDFDIEVALRNVNEFIFIIRKN